MIMEGNSYRHEKALRTIAVITLIFGIIGTLVLLRTVIVKNEELPCIIMSLCPVIVSIIIWALLMVISNISTNLFKINNALNHNKDVDLSRNFDELIQTAKEDLYIGNNEECKKYLLRSKYRLENNIEDIKDIDYMKSVVEKNKDKIAQIDKLLLEIQKK
jgi:hypothetical protein